MDQRKERGPAYPIFGTKDVGDPSFWPPNLEKDPYEWNVDDTSRGLTYFNNTAANSTLVSDNMEMARRLKAFVPASSVKRGNQPINNLFTPEKREQEDDRGGDYKSMYQ